ncbi:MAG: gluconate 2-dehydrogenase subunit 3 family protein [Thermoleophilia bacterium]|nr:gluconate 2-dehydrogenase subunit 3 family protein [Thermoleophilia bacterium]
MKARDQLGAKELQLIEERRRSGYRRESLEYFGEVEAELRALIARLLPGVPEAIDLAGFVDAHAANPIGRGDRSPGLPPIPDLFALGLRRLRDFAFVRLPADEQDQLIARMRRGQADEEFGLPAKEFIDRLLVKALAGYLAHPDTWERIGFNGPAYPNGYAWINPTAVARRHEGFPGASRL